MSVIDIFFVKTRLPYFSKIENLRYSLQNIKLSKNMEILTFFTIFIFLFNNFKISCVFYTVFVWDFIYN